MLRVTTLASGSGGNSLLVSGGGVHILIDAGISCRRIIQSLSSLGVDPAGLSAVLVTHEHSDHISGLAVMVKKLPLHIYCSPGTAHQLANRIPILCEHLHRVEPGTPFSVGPLTCCAFATSHDCAQSTGYTVELNGRRIALATDLGHVTESVRSAVLGSQIVVLESNHDVDWLRSGPYPPYLQQRILGDRGHLCNEDGAELAAQAVAAGAHTVILAHLSSENNTPARALEVTRLRLAAMGVDAERDITLTVAPKHEPSPVFSAEKEGCIC